MKFSISDYIIGVLMTLYLVILAAAVGVSGSMEALAPYEPVIQLGILFVLIIIAFRVKKG